MTELDHHRPRRSSLLLILLSLLAATTAQAQGQPGSDYLRDIKPVLKERCFACHGALKQESDLRLDTVVAMREHDILGSDSELLARITSTDSEVRMPPEGEPLKAHEIDSIRKWLANGALAPADEEPEADPKSHWAFQRIERPDGLALPQTNPIDVYFAARHKASALTPQRKAQRTILLRRIYLDLTGLPPTTEQLASPDPLPKIIDELLSSPQYGERWGRHWMDVWRYSDWYGLGNEVRDSQKNLWRWRDWIVSSLNENKGYDQMVREMLAGDEIAPDDPKVLAATGFLARSWYKFNRTTWLDNTIEHTGKAFMGLTMNCAKCHDHKYDPITHLDYYQFRAIFEPHQVRVDAAPGALDLANNGLTRVYDGNLGAATYLHERGEESKADQSRALKPASPAFLAANVWQSPKPIELPLEAYRPEIQTFVQEGLLAQSQAKVTAAESHLQQTQQQLAAANKQKQKATSKDPNPAQQPSTEPDKKQPGVGEAILVDDFSKARPDLWDVSGNDWRYQGGLLSLTKPSIDTCWLRSKATHPQDFELTLKFRTTGGDRYQSVGIRFDVDQSGNNSHWVYTSVGGSKVHLAQTVEGNDVYTQAVAPRPIQLNQEYTLNLKVRGPLINVALDGEFLLAYHLPKRNPGRVQLLAYDATADFYSIELRHLPKATKLQTSSPPAKPMAAPAPAITQSVVDLAVANLKLAQAEHAYTQARIDADNATYRKTGDGSIDDARRKLLERNLAQAKVDLLDPKKATKAAETIKKLEADRQAGNLPGYQPPTVSTVSLLKTPNKDALPAGEGYPQTSTGRRTALANWLTHRDHPLTARVAVNHIWMRHFGAPLVESIADFGLRAPQPVHQELLDYLAIELIESGWDMKQLHRLMLSSQTWQRSSSNLGADQQTLANDPNNRNYWRMNSRRMEAQVLRDSLLHLAGTLDLTQGGAPITPSPNARRRSLYFFHSRDGRSKFLETFDDADVFACYRRSESIVPQQALAMMNSQTAATAAQQIAATFKPELSAETFVRSAFLKILARQPTDAELTESLSYLKDQPRREHFIHALLNLNDFLVIR